MKQVKLTQKWINFARKMNLKLGGELPLGQYRTPNGKCFCREISGIILSDGESFKYSQVMSNPTQAEILIEDGVNIDGSIKYVVSRIIDYTNNFISCTEEEILELEDNLADLLISEGIMKLI